MRVALVLSVLLAVAALPVAQGADRVDGAAEFTAKGIALWHEGTFTYWPLKPTVLQLVDDYSTNLPLPSAAPQVGNFDRSWTNVSVGPGDMVTFVTGPGAVVLAIGEAMGQAQHGWTVWSGSAEVLETNHVYRAGEGGERYYEYRVPASLRIAAEDSATGVQTDDVYVWNATVSVTANGGTRTYHTGYEEHSTQGVLRSRNWVFGRIQAPGSLYAKAAGVTIFGPQATVRTEKLPDLVLLRGAVRDGQSRDYALTPEGGRVIATALTPASNPGVSGWLYGALVTALGAAWVGLRQRRTGALRRAARALANDPCSGRARRALKTAARRF